MTPEDRGPTPFFLDFPTRDRERLGQGGEAGLVRSAAGGEDTGPDATDAHGPALAP